MELRACLKFIRINLPKRRSVQFDEFLRNFSPFRVAEKENFFLRKFKASLRF